MVYGAGSRHSAPRVASNGQRSGGMYPSGVDSINVLYLHKYADWRGFRHGALVNVISIQNQFPQVHCIACVVVRLFADSNGFVNNNTPYQSQQSCVAAHDAVHCRWAAVLQEKRHASEGIKGKECETAHTNTHMKRKCNLQAKTHAQKRHAAA